MTDERDSLRAWLALLSTSNTIKKTVDSRMRRQFGLSLSRFDILAALDRAGQAGCSAGTLSSHLKVTEGNTTQITAPLVEERLISRTACANDGRVAIFRLTKKGRRVFGQMASANRRWIAQAFSALSPEEVAALRRLLAALKQPASIPEEEAA